VTSCGKVILRCVVRACMELWDAEASTHGGKGWFDATATIGTHAGTEVVRTERCVLHVWVTVAIGFAVNLCGEGLHAIYNPADPIHAQISGQTRILAALGVFTVAPILLVLFHNFPNANSWHLMNKVLWILLAGRQMHMLSCKFHTSDTEPTMEDILTGSISLLLIPVFMVHTRAAWISACLLALFAAGILMSSAHASTLFQIRVITLLFWVGAGCYMMSQQQSGIQYADCSDSAAASDSRSNIAGCGSGTGYNTDSETHSGESPAAVSDLEFNVLDDVLEMDLSTMSSQKRARCEPTTPISLTEGATTGSGSSETLLQITDSLASALIQVSKDALLIMDPPTGQLIGINDLFCELLHTLGLNNSIVGDMLLKQFLHSHMKPPRFVGMIKTTDGRECHLDVTMAMIQNHQRSQIMCSIRDITNKITTMDLYAQLLANQEQCQVELF